MTQPRDPITRVLAVPGSLRRDSYNRRLLAAAAGCAPPGLALTLYDDLGTIPLFSEDLEAATGGAPEAVRRLRRAVSAADGLLIATPEYNQSLPGVLKNAIDWLSRPGPETTLAGKPVALVGATAGPWGTRLAQSALRHVLNATESLVLPAPAMYVRKAEELFDDAGRLRDARVLESLKRVIEALASWIDRWRPGDTRPT